GRIDLHDRAQHHELPVALPSSDLRDEIDVHALVDDPAVADPRMRDRHLVGRSDRTTTGRPEVGDIDAARKAMDVWMAGALRGEKACPSRQDEVRLVAEI